MLEAALHRHEGPCDPPSSGTAPVVDGDLQVFRADRLSVRPVNLRKGGGTIFAKQVGDDFCSVLVRIQETGNLPAQHGGLIQNAKIPGYRQMRPVSRQCAAVVGLIGRSMKNRQRHPQEVACETMRILVSPMAAQAKPIAEYAPRRFGQIGIPVGHQVIATRLARDHNRSALMDAAIDKRCRKNGLRFSSILSKLYLFQPRPTTTRTFSNCAPLTPWFVSKGEWPSR